MYKFDAGNAPNRNAVHLFIFCVLIMFGTGLATLYSSSYAFALRFFKDGNYFIVRQAIFGAAGLVLFFIFSIIDLEKIRKFIFPLVGFSAFLCFLTRIPGIGVERYGASRWIEIGHFSYQPSEMVKIVLPLYLAHIMDKKTDNIDNFYSGILPPVIVTGLFFGLIYMQNNFSTAVFLVFNAMVIFFLAGMRFRYFFAAVAMILPISALLVFTKEHRVRRLVSFIRPNGTRLERGIRLTQAGTRLYRAVFGEGE